MSYRAVVSHCVRGVLWMRLLSYPHQPQAADFLTEKSRAAGLPNSGEILCYYPLFNGACGRHRDWYSTSELDDYYRLGVDPTSNEDRASIRGTNTLVFTMGNAPMKMPLSFPEDKKDANDRNFYKSDPLLEIPLLDGTLLIFSPNDDLFFCHEASFMEEDATGCRVAFVFRWANPKRASFFYTSGPNMHKQKKYEE